MAGMNTPTLAMKMLIQYYKQREIRLAKELLNKCGYTYRQIGDLQGITKQAAFTYYQDKEENK